jgi:quercetin dioxygenase-like cupin family protein
MTSPPGPAISRRKLTRRWRGRKLAAMSTDPSPQRKRVAIFYGKDAGPLGEDRMPTEGMTPGIMAGVEKVMSSGKAGVGELAELVFAEPGATGVSLVRVWFKSGYMLPAHSHSSDCLYYVVGGELRIGSHVLHKGDGFFIPANKAYAYEAGPDGVEVLEFRNATHFNIVLQAADQERWDRMAANYAERAAIWENETVPPSER